jgi:hypothetical protein
MAPPMPQFPALDAWQSMDESQQDALIERIAAAQRRRVLAGRLAVALVCAAAAAGLGFALYVLA